MFRWQKAFTIVAATLLASAAIACTNLIVTPGASEDGSTYICYTCDGEFHPQLRHTPAEDHAPGDSVVIEDWSGNVRGKIHQVPHTYAVTRLMNEHQLVIGETTFDGRLELQNKEGILHYWDLMLLALKRARTAREAIDVITDLVEQYGYRSTGESFSIGDTKEAWILEMIGAGNGATKPIWVAQRVPDGRILAHANKARITEFPLKDKKNCLYSDNVIDVAVEHGYYNPNSGKPFNFQEAYCPTTPRNLRYADTRVWSIYRRANPDLNLSPEYHRGNGTQGEPYPLWIKPAKKLSSRDVFYLIRDHYEGTDYDMTKGVDAGPYGNPNRWRPMTWEVDSTEYVWERPISTQQTGFSFVGQARHWLPDAVGGVLWYGVDDTYFTVYVPLYAGINDIPPSFARGGLAQFSWDSAWWVFNFVANYATLRYDYMKEDIQTVQTELENEMFALQPAVEMTAKHLAKENPELMTKYLTDYSVTRGEMIVKRWRELGEMLIRKYNDGYVQDKPGHPNNGTEYRQEWLRKVVQERPNQFKLPEKKKDAYESQLID